MLQLILHLSDGKVELLEAPEPRLQANHVISRSINSLISAGTEGMLLHFGSGSLLQKVKSQPDKVKAVMEKVRADGVLSTYKAVSNKLSMPIALGYCHVGRVDAVGRGVDNIKLGDRIVSNAPHSEVVCSPKTLVCKIPDEVNDEEASFTVIGAIGLHAIRLARAELGETFVVIGLGLIGLVTAQLLRAHGCRVIGVDFDRRKLALAEKFDVIPVHCELGSSPEAAVKGINNGLGVDGVLVCAGTNSPEPIQFASRMCRKRGRIILVGTSSPELSRADFYEKELSFQVSCSYGPGRYDPVYEKDGQDYPLSYVRWTIQRNFSAVLQMMAEKKLLVQDFISHRFSFSDAENAYSLITQKVPHVGIILSYGNPVSLPKQQAIVYKSPKPDNRDTPIVGVVGAGNFAQQVILPILKKSHVRLKHISCNNGLSGALAARKFGFESATCDLGAILDDHEINTVFILTQHNTHADLVCAALAKGKHVFVEKPLATSHEQLDAVVDAYRNRQFGQHLMVGFNRRFAPLLAEIKNRLPASLNAAFFSMTVNAGQLPPEHWTLNKSVGGGRLIGEACHFVDLVQFLSGSTLLDTSTTLEQLTETGDSNYLISLQFANGSAGTISYLVNGTSAFPKERLEVFCQGKVFVLDNFRRLTGFGLRKPLHIKRWQQDKGHSAEIQAFLTAITQGRDAPIDADDIFRVSRFMLGDRPAPVPDYIEEVLQMPSLDQHAYM